MLGPAQRRRILLGAGAVFITVGPAWVETAAHRRALDALTCQGTCGSIARLDVDIRGLHLQGVRQNRRGVELQAHTVRASVHWDGVTVDVTGLDATVRPPGPDRPPSSAGKRPRTPESGATDVIHRNAPRVPVPITVRTTGSVHAVVPGATLAVRDPRIAISPRGSLAATFGLTARAGEVTLESRGPVHAQVVPGSREIRATGWLGISGQAALPLQLRVEGTELRAQVGDPDVGTLIIRGSVDPSPARILAREFPLAAFGDLATHLPGSLTLGLDTARLTGDITVTGGEGSGLHASFAGVELTNLSLQQPQLSRHRMELHALGIDGDVWTRDGTVGGQVVVSHQEAQIQVSGQMSPDRLRMDVQLPTTDCQDLVESMPRGTVDMIRGVGLRGQVGGHLQFEFESGAATRAPATAGGPAWDPPGELTFEFPFIESCDVEREPPRVDLVGLAGPYRHRFTTDRGEQRQRTLTPGAPGYAALAGVSLVARAFVTTEDTRFWLHDGFDREQIERAFWHNLGARGFSRGASTITQQTARNLWLGIDRSLSRKLQEALLASRLEAHLSKERILELYVNLIELGPEVHGVTEAARYHFGKRPQDLTVLESVYVASLAPAPRTLSLRHHRDGIPSQWTNRVREQARRMAVHGHITWPQYHAAMRQKLVLASSPS